MSPDAQAKKAAENVLLEATPHSIDDGPDNHRNAPRPDKACLYGLIGEIAAAGGETEANPYAIAANALAYLSCAVGRGPFMPVGNTWHHPRLFTLHIGRSGRGRKGDAVSLMTRIDHAVRRVNEYAAPQVHRGGLSSREGLIYLIHDAYQEGKEEVPAIHDKRLWVVESEFANVLHQGKRDGNTLSAALRDCWDGVDMKPATKTARMSATNPHVCLSGAITPGELHSLMATRELTNGFANRFLMIWAERLQIIPFPRAASQAEVDRLAERLVEVMEFCGSHRPGDPKDSMKVELSIEAAKRYTQLYTGELNQNSDGERIAALVERRAPMLLRIAMLLALTDLSTKVEVHHIQAALAWIRFSVESVKFIFASAEEEAKASKTSDNAEKIMVHLGKHQTATRSELNRQCFGGHASKEDIDTALDELLTATPPLIEVHTKPRPKGTPGTPTKHYSLLRANSAKSANSEYRRGLAPDSDACEVSESCEVLASDPRTLRTIRTVREPQKTVQTRASIDDSLNSHNPQPFNSEEAF